MLFFQHCALCKSACRRALCAGCRGDVMRLVTTARCRQCAAPAAGLCGGCIGKPPYFDRTHAALHYAPPLDSMIKDFKFHGRWHLAKLLAGFVTVPAADMMLPVPLFAARERWRGFNQARELARALPSQSPPLHNDVLSRISDTQPQSQLPDIAARRKNVRGAFRADKTLSGKTVLVVDDVMTSGATLNEIARVLKKAGAAAVVNIVVARTVPGGVGV